MKYQDVIQNLQSLGEKYALPYIMHERHVSHPYVGLDWEIGDEERITLVELEMEKAKRIFAEIDVLVNAGLWSNAASRLYYSVYHAVCALLIKDGHKATTHQGNHIGFGVYYVKTGIFPPEYGRFYNRLQTLREQSDYNCIYDVTPEDLNEKIPLAKELIQKIEVIVNDWMQQQQKN